MNTQTALFVNEAFYLVYFEERNFDSAGEETGRVVEEWSMDPAVSSGGVKMTSHHPLSASKGHCRMEVNPHGI